MQDTLLYLRINNQNHLYKAATSGEPIIVTNQNSTAREIVMTILHLEKNQKIRSQLFFRTKNVPEQV